MTTNLLLRSFNRFYPNVYSQKLYFFKNLSRHSNLIKISRLCSTISCYEDKDPAPSFFDEKVQAILKKLTGFNLEKVYKNRYLEDPDTVEEYKFLTKDELEERVSASVEEAKRLLQMPPVIKEREPINEVLSFDPAIQGEETSNIVVTDISFGLSDGERVIVVREPNGVLRKATWNERARMNQIYNPRPGRFHKVPPLFKDDEYLQDALNREEYEFVLDFACSHFEPNDALYHRATTTAYEHIRKRSNFESLHSTRHFGPMCFYYGWTKKIDTLLIHYIHQEKIEEAADLVTLYYTIHDSIKAISLTGKEEQLIFVKKYVAEDSKMKSNLELALQAYDETVRERENLEKTLKASHGIS